jgi:hypothetical protein
MQKLYQITVPGLQVSADWRLIHDRLLDEFSEVTDVLPTTMQGTILIVYEGSDDAGAWLKTVSETIVSETILHFRSRIRPGQNSGSANSAVR